MARGAGCARALVACAAGALALSLTDPSPAFAQTRTAAQAERDRRAEAARAERLRAEANAARAELNQLDARMAASGRRRAEAEAAAQRAEARLAELRTQMAAHQTQQANAQRALEAAVIAAAFAERRVEPRVVRVGIFAAAAAPALANTRRSSVRALEDARTLEAAVTEEQNVLLAAESAIEAERAELANLIERRRAAQAQLTADAQRAERRTRQLAAEARSLRELAQRAAAASTRTPAASASGPSVIPASWRAPVTGRVTRTYGARANEGAPSQGVALATRSGAQITAPAAGQVTYAGPFRSYGEVLILNVEGGYALVLTGLGAINVRVGDTVSAGQPIGEMPASDTQAPELYVEVRRNGEPVDPGRWLAASNG